MDVQYERLPPICHRCRTIGHNVTTCKVVAKEDQQAGKKIEKLKINEPAGETQKITVVYRPKERPFDARNIGEHAQTQDQVDTKHRVNQEGGPNIPIPFQEGCSKHHAADTTIDPPSMGLLSSTSKGVLLQRLIMIMLSQTQRHVIPYLRR